MNTIETSILELAEKVKLQREKCKVNIAELEEDIEKI